MQFQEDTIHQLDQSLVKQNDLIDLLQRKIQLLEAKINELALEKSAVTPPTNEKPPHY